MKPSYYNNQGGSLYAFSETLGLNSYQFDLIKRVLRCRYKGNFSEDLDKSIFLCELYAEEESNPVLSFIEKIFPPKKTLNRAERVALEDLRNKQHINLYEDGIISSIVKLNRSKDLKGDLERIAEGIKHYKENWNDPKVN